MHGNYGDRAFEYLICMGERSPIRAGWGIAYYQKHGRTYHRLVAAGGGGQTVQTGTDATKPEKPPTTPTSDVGKQPTRVLPPLPPWINGG